MLSDKINSSVPTETPYRYFKLKGNAYVFRNLNLVNWITGIIMFFAAAGIAVSNLSNSDWFRLGKNSMLYSLFALFASLVNIRLASRTLIIDTAAATISVSHFWGLQYKYFPLDRFKRFIIVRNRMNGLKNGNDIQAEYDEGNTIKTLTLAAIWSNKKVDAVLAEMQDILSKKSDDK